MLEQLAHDLGLRISIRRRERNLTQLEAAELLGVSERTLQNWEAGSSFPRARHRRAIDRFLGDEAERV